MTNKTCPICGKGQLREQVSDFNAELQHDSGDRRAVIVRNVKSLCCDSCGETILDVESENRISEAQRSAMGRLTGAQLQEFRRGLRLSQEEMADLLGTGRKTYCRWESPDYFQSEAFDRFIRLLMLAPSNLDALRLIRREKNLPASETGLAARFPYVKDVASVRAVGERFGVALATGPFKLE